MLKDRLEAKIPFQILEKSNMAITAASEITS